MRFLYVTIGVLGGLACLAVVYVFGLLAMAYNGGRGSMQVIFPGVLLVLALAAVLTLIAACMNPRLPWTRRLLGASAALWIAAVALLGVVSYVDPVSTVTLVAALKSTALLAAPSLLPLAALAVARLTKSPT
jgi:hypothetical protein